MTSEILRKRREYVWDNTNAEIALKNGKVSKAERSKIMKKYWKQAKKEIR